MMARRSRPCCPFSRSLFESAFSRSFKNRNIDDFFYLAGILRLATKYFIGHLRHQAIAYLTRTWSYTLQGHDEMVETALSAPIVDKLTYPYVHPLHVLNLARETHVRIIIPSVLYFLSLYRIEDLIRGDHAKLKVDHPSRPSSTLSASDITDYSIIFQRRIEYTMDFVRRICGDRRPAEGCVRGEMCSRAFASLGLRLSRTWMIRTALIHYIVQVTRDIGGRQSDFCTSCRTAFLQDSAAFREEVWEGLPALFGMPSWEDLAASDLPPPSS